MTKFSNKNIFKSLPFSILALVLFGFILWPTSGAIASENLWIQKSIDYSINADFTAAESLLTARAMAGDTSLALDFYQASVLNSKLVHYENNISPQSFLKAVGKIIHRAEKALAGNNQNVKRLARTHYYLGNAYAFLAVYNGRQKNWYNAIKFGLSAKDNLEKALRSDSTLYDAYLGLGSYAYWSSAKVGWIPFIADRREDGIRMVKKAIRLGTYGRYTAMHQLVYILLDFGHYAQAEKWALQCIQKYPQSPFMNWAYSHVFMKEKNYSKAIESYKNLYQLLLASKNLNPNHPLVCLARLADMYARSGDCVAAKKQINLILENNFYKANRNIDEVERLIAEIQDRCD